MESGFKAYRADSISEEWKYDRKSQMQYIKSRRSLIGRKPELMERIEGFGKNRSIAAGQRNEKQGNPLLLH